MASSPDHIVYFDGYCVLCNGSVDVLLKLDKKKKLHYASNTSESYKQNVGDLVTDDSIVVYSKGVLYTRSAALFKIIEILPWSYRALLVFRLLPGCLSDIVYGGIARVRYKVFGKRKSCRMPSQEEASRFLS